ncbi:hypothetical protein [Sporomusa acidovorans]|uniref:AAT family amino acid transporter n=1 Tax=Sporomusa acidovorans (strain ATCC 49682 / DSM 3132 / Mol) TaxID=1123286 RepID=A0ABZ3JA75_SPOA4|nr:hypothetical protein [Sporomusa acidovorans]OZC16116.1 hypothetical protein SPACI_44830 [Sporomusa acidovorans DSM 3132]SDD86337.1 amino acid transporter, AAT family [Sporomusa acidovorans]
MNELVTKQRSQNPLVIGGVLFGLCFLFSFLYWPVWGTLSKMLAVNLAGTALASADTEIAAKYIGVVTEGTFFWCIITAWIWQTLVCGNYGKYWLTKKQPWAGLWYTLISFAAGIIGFLVIVSFVGIWWQPFNLAVMLTPANNHELHLAIEGWEVGNFFALASIMVQILYVAAFHKWPFAGKVQQSLEAFGAFMTSMFFCTIIWVALFFPSFMKLEIGGQAIVSPPFGTWPAFLAFAQAFILVFLMPAEGGEMYPTKLFASKQPWMGIVGTILALAGGFVLPPLYKLLLAPLNLMPGAPLDLVATIVELASIVWLLSWHHLFSDYPGANLVKNTAQRVIMRYIIWFAGGFVWGLFWLIAYKSLPFAGNNLGMGFPVMGPVAGQFVFLMALLYCNTFFDKWPMVYQEEKISNQSASFKNIN